MIKEFLKNKLFTNSLIYGFSGTLVAIIPFFLLPFLTRNLSQADYGLSLYFSSLITISLPIISFGSINAISVRFFQLKAKEFASYLWSCVAVLILSVILIHMILFIFKSLISQLIIIDFSWLIIGTLTASLWGFSQACGILLIAKSNPKKYFIINACIGFFTISLTVILISFYGFSWKGFGIALFVAHLIAAVISLIILISDTKISSINKNYCFDSLRFGMPVMVHSFAISLITYFDRIIISKYLTIEDLAVYGVAFQIGILISFVAQAFNKAFVPWLYEKLKTKSELNNFLIVRGTYLIFIGIGIFTFIFTLILELIIRLYAGEIYIGATNIAILISIGAAFNAAYLMVVNYMFYAGKTFFLSLISISVAIGFIALSLILVPSFGIIGAASSFLLANLFLFIAVWIASAKFIRMPWTSKQVFKSLFKFNI